MNFHQTITRASLLIPAGGSVVAIVHSDFPPSNLDLGITVLFYFLTMLGLTAGYHRLFAHRSYSAHRVLRIALAVLGEMAIQGPITRWVSYHRRHHAFTDRTGDPHSPRPSHQNAAAAVRAFWHAHLGWLLAERTFSARYVRDLLDDPDIRRLDRLYFLWALLSLIIPSALGGVLASSWSGARSALLWGGFVRIFLVQHVTFSVNSWGHSVGGRAFDTKDRSRNNLLVGFLSLGEWHNSHHAFPNLPWQTTRWWQLDPTAWFIRLMARVHLASRFHRDPT